MESDNKTPVEALPKQATGGGPRDGGRDMGEALRSVYDRTVRESVPDEMLDLLSKLD